MAKNHLSLFLQIHVAYLHFLSVLYKETQEYIKKCNVKIGEIEQEEIKESKKSKKLQ